MTGQRQEPECFGQLRVVASLFEHLKDGGLHTVHPFTLLFDGRFIRFFFVFFFGGGGACRDMAMWYYTTYITVMLQASNSSNYI